MTKVEAIKKVLEDHKGIATWEILYNEIEKYYPAPSKHLASGERALEEYFTGKKEIIDYLLRNDCFT